MKDFLKHFFIPHKGNDYKPHFLREGVVIAMGIGAIALFLSSLGSNLALRHHANLASVYSSVLVDLTNQARKSNNEGTLTVNPTLEAAAKLKADDMSEKEYFAHTSPEGVTPWHWFAVAGYNFSYAGENLAIDFKDSEDIEDAWLNSPGHRANILNNNFTEIGIATKEGTYQGHKTIYVVQLFGKPKVAVLPPAPVTVAITQPVITNPSPASALTAAPVVKGESSVLEQPVKVLKEDTHTLLVEAAEEPVVEPAPSAQAPIPAETTPVVSSSSQTFYTPWYDRVLFNQPHVVAYALQLIMIIVSISLLLYIFVEIKVQHPKQIMYGLCLLLVVGVLAYWNHSFMMTNAPLLSLLS